MAVMDEVRAEVRHLAERLVCEVPVVRRVQHQPVVHRAAALLAELQEAVRPSGERSGGGGGSTAPGLPIAVNALDLLCSIEAEVQARYWIARSATRRAWGWTLPERLGFWIGTVLDGGTVEDAKECRAVLRRWVAQIEDLLDPPRVVHIPRECPECGALQVIQDSDGERVAAHALVATLYEGAGRVEVTCRGCLTVWGGADIHHLEAQTRMHGPVNRMTVV